MKYFQWLTCLVYLLEYFSNMGEVEVNLAGPFPFIPLLLGGISAASSALSGREGARTSSTNQQSSGTQSSVSTSSGDFQQERTPVLSPEFLQTQAALAGALDLDTDEIPDDLVEEFRLNGIAGLNRRLRNLENSVQGNLARSGLQFSPGPQNLSRGFVEQVRNAGLTDINSQAIELALQIPQIREGIRASRFDSGVDFLRTIPIGQRIAGIDTTTRNTSGNFSNVSSGTNVAPGQGVVGGAIQGGLDALAESLGRQQQRKLLGNV